LSLGKQYYTAQNSSNIWEESRLGERITSHAAETPSPESIKPIEVDFAEVAEKIREISEKVEAEESELEALRRKVREYEEKIEAMESELKIAEAVKKYIKPELVEGAVRLAELESKVRELEEKLAEEKRLRIEAEKSREEAYSIAGSSIKKAIEALEEALKKLTVSKPIQPVKEQVRLPPMESRIIRYWRRGGGSTSSHTYWLRGLGQESLLRGSGKP